MTVSADAERAAQLALLEMAEKLQRPRERVEVLHRLVDVELSARELEQADEWLSKAAEILDGIDDPATVLWDKQRDLGERVASVRAGVTSELATERDLTSSRDEPEPGGAADTTMSELVIGATLTAIPERYAYVRDAGPQRPSGVHYVELTEYDRTADGATTIGMAIHMIMASLFLVIMIVDLATDSSLYAGISFLLALVFVTAAMVAYRRIRVALNDDGARHAGTYRLGWYFDGDMLLLRTSTGFSAFPRSRVLGVRIASRYDTESNQTSYWLILKYRDGAGHAVEMPLDFAFADSQSAIVRRIETWRQKSGD